MTDEPKAATFQLCGECRRPYTPTPENRSGFCSWECFDTEFRPDVDAAKVLHGFLGPDVTMTRVQCQCHLPDADPYACEADDCTYEFPELSPFSGGPVEGRDAKVSKVCGSCDWRTSVWHVDDGSAEEELHRHMSSVHGASAKETL